MRLAVEVPSRRLQTHWIDLYLLRTSRTPVPWIEETLAVLDDLITEGQGALHRAP